VKEKVKQMDIRSTNSVNRKKKLFRQIAQQRESFSQIAIINVTFIRSLQDDVHKYHGQKLGLLEPHVFALAEAAYRNIIDNDENQVRLMEF
jgi:hypothetical protein